MNIRASFALVISALIVLSPFQVEPAAVNTDIFLPHVTRSYTDMVFVAAGKFRMGCHPAHNGGHPCSAYEIPLHVVYLDSYFIDKYEVTNREYAECVSAGICTAPINFSSHTRISYFNNSAYADYPVMYITKGNAQEYCRWENKRLPTEAEWEKAARGTRVRAFPWGDQLPNCSLGNSFDEATASECVGDTTPVGSYPLGASPYGVLDMAGNVWEWVNDWWQDDYYSISPFMNPPGPPDIDGRDVIRSGYWGSSSYQLRAAHRIFEVNYLPEEYLKGIGFRCAVSFIP